MLGGHWREGFRAGNEEQEAKRMIIQTSIRVSFQRVLEEHPRDHADNIGKYQKECHRRDSKSMRSVCKRAFVALVAKGIAAHG